jgi:hypothetical protein
MQHLKFMTSQDTRVGLPATLILLAGGQLAYWMLCQTRAMWGGQSVAQGSRAAAGVHKPSLLLSEAMQDGG